MKSLEIKGTEDTPHIICSGEKITISGRSLPEDVTTFYQPLFDVINDIVDDDIISLDIKLDYFNTASSKILLDIFYLLEEESNNKDITINWFYDEDDEDMSEAIDEYNDLIDININKIIL